MRTRCLVFWALLFQFVLLIPRVGSAQTAKDLEQKLLALNTSDWRTAFAVGSDVADAKPAAGFAAIKAAWPKITNVAARQQLMKAFYYALPFPLHPRYH